MQLIYFVVWPITLFLNIKIINSIYGENILVECETDYELKYTDNTL